MKQLAMDVDYEAEPCVWEPGWVLWDDPPITQDLYQQLTLWMRQWISYYFSLGRVWLDDDMRSAWITRGQVLAVELNRELLGCGFIVWPAFKDSGFRRPTRKEFSHDDISPKNARAIEVFLAEVIEQQGLQELIFPEG